MTANSRQFGRRSRKSSANSAERPFPVRAVATRIAGLDRQTGRGLGRRSADPDQRPAGRQDRVHGAARSGRRHVAERDRFARLWSTARRSSSSRACRWWCAASRTSSPAAALFTLRLSEIRAVGVGELLARIERLRQLLAAEGLFDTAAQAANPVPAQHDRRLDYRPGQRG